MFVVKLPNVLATIVRIIPNTRIVLLNLNFIQQFVNCQSTLDCRNVPSVVSYCFSHRPSPICSSLRQAARTHASFLPKGNSPRAALNATIPSPYRNYGFIPLTPGTADLNLNDTDPFYYRQHYNSSDIAARSMISEALPLNYALLSSWMSALRRFPP